jgi:hypothetical protein
MHRDTNPRLAIRTVLVTTRVAVKSNLAAGQPELGRRSAEQGTQLLESLAVEPGGDAGLSRAYADARRELQTLAGLGEQPSPVAFAVRGVPLPSRTGPR